MFFIHVKMKVNSGEEGTEIEALAGKVPLDCTQNKKTRKHKSTAT